MAMDIGGGEGKRGRATPTMNVTPLVDVVLVLLIIFMVVTPLLAKQFWIHLPNPVQKDQPDTPSDDSAVVVRVTTAGDILINRDKVAKADFPDRLRRVLAAKQDRTIFFDAEDDADFATAVETLDLARGGGASTIAVMTEALK
jgi:biopolymer transport protein TolR